MAKVNDPIVINGTRVKNRLTMAPTVKFDYAGEDGQFPGRELVGDVGLVGENLSHSYPLHSVKDGGNGAVTTSGVRDIFIRLALGEVGRGHVAHIIGPVDADGGHLVA